jgi:predicted Kef-type K+ transport protein
MVRKSISEILVCNKIQTIGEFRLVLAGQHVDAGVVEDEMGDLALSVDLARAIIAECQDKPTQATSTSYIDEYADLFSALLASVQTRTRQIIDTIERGQ